MPLFVSLWKHPLYQQRLVDGAESCILLCSDVPRCNFHNKSIQISIKSNKVWYFTVFNNTLRLHYFSSIGTVCSPICNVDFLVVSMWFVPVKKSTAWLNLLVFYAWCGLDGNVVSCQCLASIVCVCAPLTERIQVFPVNQQTWTNSLLSFFSFSFIVSPRTHAIAHTWS